MPPPRGKGRFSKDKRPKRNNQALLFRRKRFCRFTVAGVTEIDYKEIDVLRDFISENGKITPARLTGTCLLYTSHLNDLLTERLLQQVASRRGMDLGQACWLAFGSEGRGEQTVATDQDLSLIHI